MQTPDAGKCFKKRGIFLRRPQKPRFKICLKIAERCLTYDIAIKIMYQVTFSNQSMSELNKLDKLTQLEIIESFGALTAEQLESGLPEIGKIRRGSKVFYRLRTGDYRIYFEVIEETQTLHAHYILHQHTLADFVFRFKLPFKEETMFEQEDNFWRYLESLKK